MKWLIGYNDLDREQKMFLGGGRKENGEYVQPFIDRKAHDYIQGFPGCGKTILLLYAVGAELYSNPKAKIVIIEFTHALKKMLEAALKELVYNGKVIDTSSVRIMTTYDFDKAYFPEKLDLVLCDEVQDVPLKVITRMKEKSKRVLVAGDHNQSIYEQDPMWRRAPATSSEIQSAINPEVTGLKILHRLCKSITQAVEAFMPNMQIMQGRIPMIKTNVQIRLWKANGKVQEAKHIIEDAIETVNINDSVGILVPTQKAAVGFANRVLDALNRPNWEPVKNQYGKYDFDSLNRHLIDNGVPMQYVGSTYGDFIKGSNLITLTTYHSSKGLDFDKVFLPGRNGCDMNVSTDLDRRVFMVAMTRSRKDLILSYNSAYPDAFVEKFKTQCLTKNLDEKTQPKAVDSDPDDLFGF